MKPNRPYAFSHFPMRSLASAAMLLCSAGLTACAVGPDFHAPPVPKSHGYAKEALPTTTTTTDVKGGEAQHFVNGMDIPAQWWTLFHSASLNAVIARALEANADVQAAQAALRAAQENYYAQLGTYALEIDANFVPSRQKVAPLIASPLTSGASLFNLHTAQLNIGYTFDLFGGVRRQAESLEAQAEMQRFQLEATYLTLASNVAAAAIQEASLRAQISATKELVRTGTEILELMHREYDLGAISMEEVLAQQTSLAQAQATLPALEKQLAQQRTLLTALTGRLPDAELEEIFELDDLQLPSDLPVSLPSKLVEQRPDVRAAVAQLHAATAQVGIAEANMLPQITLNASVGSSANAMSKLFTADTGFWSVMGGLTQPLFAGGALLHKKRAADAALEQVAAQYRGTVITAFQNVSDCLRALQYDAETLKAQATAEHAAAESLAMARQSLQLGSISYLELLNAEQSYRQAEISFVQARASRYADTVALFEALGGGWWNREVVTAEK